MLFNTARRGRVHSYGPATPLNQISAAKLLVLAAALWAAGCRKDPAVTKAAPRDPASIPITANSPNGAKPPAFAAGAEDGTWAMPAKDYASTRFSGLDTINAGNAAKLKLAWTFSTGVVRGHEAGALVVNQTLYYVTPYPNYLYALDLTKPGAPMKWVYKPQIESAAQGVACCDVVNRGAAYHDGKIFYNTLNNHTIAVDAETGKEVWNTRLGDINHGETITMAPLVVKGKVLVGNSGGEMGVRGWITAVDAGSGKVAWRAYSTGPDADVLIGANFKPFYPSDRGKDLGVSSWPPQAWEIGGGSVWGWISYDPELDLIYHGTGNPGPWNPELRPGDNKWTAGIFARRPDTGEAIWAYQWSPHDLFDYDGINENLLLDLPVKAKPARCYSGWSVTATSTSWTGPQGRSCRPIPSATSPPRKGST